MPSELRRDVTRESHSPAHHRREPLRVNQLRLEFDDEQRLTLRMPGEDVDDPALAIDREADFRSPRPAIGRREETNEGFVQIGVCRIQDPIHVGALPADPDIDSRAERRSHIAQHGQLRPGHSTTLDAAYQLATDAGAASHIGLAQVLTDADSADGVADANVVHAGMVANGASLALLGALGTPAIMVGRDR